MWFLPVYFFSEFLFLLLYKKKTFNIIFTLVIITYFIFLGEVSIPDSLIQIRRALIGYVFIFIGNVCAQYNIHRKFSPICTIPIILLSSTIAINMGFSSMGGMNNPLFYIINATLISISILALLTNYTNKIRNPIETILIYFGVNSIIVLGTNNLIIEIVRLLDHYITNSYLLYNGYIGGFILFIIITLLEIPIIKLLEGKFK